ncbi:UNVERIFIED_CONTAM: putative ribonuclease H protein [Sesamum calycinum]|uniref:Ribonuclease H protein n=1 Tax=Sesamum calycinum TaxID=2727403 RepID=A0AAW2KEI4_9LAMI
MLANEAWLDRWPNSSYLAALPSTSDHSPLILTGMTSNAEHAIFKFDNYLAQLPGFLDSVENIWKHRISGLQCMKTLLGGSTPRRMLDLGFLRSELKHTITTAEASLLVAPVTHFEVKEAFFDIDVESAPGPDGYTSAFYRAAWPIIGQSMFEAIGEFFRTGKLLKQINTTLLALIPKVNMPTYVSDYRPISCCNVLYKAITKIIVKRIQRVLPLLIDYSQNAFVPGRSISDNILLAQELLAGYNQTRLPERCTLKVDIQKAYDSVEWDFLLEVLKLFNFPLQFITLIEQCISTASFSVSLNGSIHGFFKGGRGLRQGLKVNPAKSQVILSRSVHNQRQQILEHLGFNEGSLPIKYLGIPLTSSRLTIADCRPLLDKVDTRLAGWNNLNLSYAGRLQLIKSVLSTLHTYWASVFILPKGVLKNLEQKMRTFLWQGHTGRGNAKVAWDQICKPKAEGGLGISSLITMNQALILKQLWRILQNDGTSIWVDWIQQYRLRHSTVWTFNRRTGSWSWKKVIKLRHLLQRGVIYKVGDGSSFSLWQDIWHERGPLCLTYPRGPVVTGLPLSSTLSSVLQGNQWCWPASSDPDIAEIMSQLPPTTLSIGQHLLVQRFGLSTMDQPWVPNAGNGCVLCDGQSTETHDHLFFNCWFSKRCLTILKEKVKFQWPYLEWKQGITWASKKWRGNHLVNAALRATLAALVYHIWAERNNRKFAATSSSAEFISNKVLEDVRLRILAAEVPSSLQTRILYRTWKLAWPCEQ